MTPRDTWIVVRNTARVLADSTRLDDIQEVGEIVGRARMTEVLREVRASAEGRRLLRDRPELNSRSVDYDALLGMREGTLGHAYASHLANNGLSADKLNIPAPTAEDSELIYLARRLNGVHDIWHPLLGLGVAGHEEVLVHAFTYGQLRLPISAMIIGFGALKHMVLERRWGVLARTMPALYRLGRAAPRLVEVRYEELWETPIVEVRERLRLHAA